MNAYMLVLMMALLALIAWYASREPGGPVDLDRATKIYLFELVLLFGGLYLHESGSRDQRFEKLFDITSSVATVAQGCAVRVDSTLATLREFERLWPARQP